MYVAGNRRRGAVLRATLFVLARPLLVCWTTSIPGRDGIAISVVFLVLQHRPPRHSSRTYASAHARLPKRRSYQPKPICLRCWFYGLEFVTPEAMRISRRAPRFWRAGKDGKGRVGLRRRRGRRLARSGVLLRSGLRLDATIPGVVTTVKLLAWRYDDPLLPGQSPRCAPLFLSNELTAFLAMKSSHSQPPVTTLPPSLAPSMQSGVWARQSPPTH
ncbi:hypothetical protein FA95DRAFT_1558982, partial [Auriscalpium vulgare]